MSTALAFWLRSWRRIIGNGLLRRRTGSAERSDVTQCDAGDRQQRRIVGRSNGRQIPHMTEKRLLRFGPEAFHVVDRRVHSSLLAQAHARPIRKAMRFVAKTRE